MKKLAIVILNWNGAELLRKYLPSVLENSVGDVIVADNASTDDSMAVMHREFPEVRTIVLDRNYGFAEGYNRSLSQIADDYEYLLLLNSDVEIRQKDWDVPLVEYMDKHRDCAACQPKLMALREPSKFEYAGAAGGFLDCYGYPFCRGRIFDTVEEDHGQYDHVEEILWATGAALLVRSADWKVSGGLDSRFFAHMEEIDLCWRLKNMGRSIVCVPTSTAYHLGGASLNYGNPRKTFLNFRNNLLMIYKNAPSERLTGMLLMRLLLDMVAALKFLAGGEKEHAKAIVRATKEFYSIRSEWKEERKRIQQLARQRNGYPRLPGIVSFSILWQYYLCGNKRFSQLRNK